MIVDDDSAHRTMLRTIIRGWGYATDEADDGDVAVEKVRERAYDAVLTDIRMVRMDGITTVREILNYNPSTPVILMTAWKSADTAVAALRLGAYDYIEKPIDFDWLKTVLQRAMEHTRLARENRELRRTLQENSLGILGRSARMCELVEMINTIAPTDATVLITGDSGTGKERVARAMQEASARRDKPFVTVNCAALNEALLESELFGHERGAFTGADRRREGRFMQANGGTLFLDEIGEIPLLLQAKLLRALQQGEIQRVGSDTPLIVDVRVLAATNRDLRSEVAEGRFREDLFYRLNVIGVEVPALRERTEDIPLLATVFLERFALANRKEIKGFTPQAMDALLKYAWPGNVRELENAVERAAILCLGDYVTERELPLAVARTSRDEGGTAPVEPVLGTEETMTLDELERNAILKTLQETGDNKSEAARRLGITRATLHNKLRRYDLES